MRVHPLFCISIWVSLVLSFTPLRLQELLDALLWLPGRGPWSLEVSIKAQNGSDPFLALAHSLLVCLCLLNTRWRMNW